MPPFLLELFGEQVDRTIGPAWYGYADGGLFRLAGIWPGRLLEGIDETAFRRLTESCSETEREHSGLEFACPPVFGCFHLDRLTAAAGYRIWGGTLANLGVLTHPAHRGSGYGRSVASGITAMTLDRGLVPHYRALHTNHPSLAVAGGLGFREYASSVAVRFHGGSVTSKSGRKTLCENNESANRTGERQDLTPSRLYLLSFRAFIPFALSRRKRIAVSNWVKEGRRECNTRRWDAPG